MRFIYFLFKKEFNDGGSAMLSRNQKNITRINETTRLIKWSHEYSGLWEIIIDKNSRYMTPEMMRRLILFLAKNELYEVIYVMLSVHKDKEYVKTAYELMFKDSIISELKKGKEGDVINRLLNYLN